MSGDTEKTEALSSLLHKTITHCHAFTKGCEEQIVNEITDNVKGLTQQLNDDEDACKLFTEENRLASDALLSLLCVISQCDSELSSVILDLFIKAGSERGGGLLLYNLGALDTVSSMAEERLHPVLVLTALSKISGHVRFTGHEAFVDGLLRIIINNIMSNDVTLKPSLCVLVNLSASCLPIQMQLRSLDRNSLLRKTFIRLVSHDDNEISVLSLAAMTSTGMSEEFNRLIDNDRNLSQILKLCFSVILSLQRSESFSYVIDVMVYLIKNKRVQQFLLNSCPQLDSFITKSVSLLTSCEDNQLSKLFDLLLELASVPAIRLMITKVVFAPVQTRDVGEQELLQHIFYLAKRSVAVDNGASVSAIKLITYIYEALSVDPSQAGSTCHLEFQYLVECLKQSELDNKREIVKLHSCQKTLASLCLLEVLCSSEAFSNTVLSEIDPSTITDILQYQLQTNPTAFDWNNKQVSPADGTSTPAWSGVGVSIVLRSMSVLMEATDKNESYSTSLNDYLQKTSLLPFIAIGLTNSTTEDIQLSLKILSKSGTLGVLQNTVLSDILSSINSRRSNSYTQQRTCDPFLSPRASPDQQYIKSEPLCMERGDVVKASPCGSPRADRDIVYSSQSSQADIADRLANLQMSGDSHISDIISVYEQKLKAQKTRETHLDDLVQAKTMALSQADRLIQQYKSRLAQVDADSHKLRAIVHESERRSEGYRDRMNEMLVDSERLQSEMERKVEDTQRALSSVKQELSTLTEIHTTLSNFNDNLKRQHRELETNYSELKEAERQKTVEKDSKILELKKANRKFDEHVKKLSTEKLGLGEQIDSLKNEKKKLEKNLKDKDNKLKVISDALNVK